LRLAPGRAPARRLLAGFEQAYAGRPLANLPVELVKALAARGGGSLSLRLRQGEAAAVDQALKTVAADKADAKQRLALVQILGEVKEPRCVPVLLHVLAQTRDDRLCQAVLAALLPFDDPAIAAGIVKLYPLLSADSRSIALGLLASRKTWTRQFLQAVDAAAIDKRSVPPEVVRKMTAHRDDVIAGLIRKHWGNVQGATTAAMQKQIEHWQTTIRAGTGSPYAGKKLFNDTCARCHTLFGQGGNIGPDLTAYKRDDLATMLLNIVNPSAEIREGYETHLVLTQDGRVLTGFLVDRDNRLVVLRSAEGTDISVARKNIDEMRVIPQSIMPEGLLSNMSDRQVRDLFAYLRSTQPLND
jgi:putative heme-binding domain-containing protein